MVEQEPCDFSSEINSELGQLISLGECLRALESPGELRDDFFLGLGDMIEGYAERIKKMLDPTYNMVYSRGQEKGRTEAQVAP